MVGAPENMARLGVTMFELSVYDVFLIRSVRLYSSLVGPQNW